MKFPDENIKNLIEFCKKNVKYISAGVLIVLLIVILAVSVSNQDGNKAQEKAAKVNEGQQVQANIEENEGEAEEKTGEETEKFLVDAIPEINSLVSAYYEAYTAGDLDTIEVCAKPVSEAEKSYIGLLSQYVEGYENIVCYSKNGPEEGSYAVSVSMDMRFDGIETMAPGLDFFYIKSDEEGKLYIDNLYSQFNLRNNEQPLDSGVEVFITSYETQKDVVELQDSIQSKYNEIVAEDEALKTMVEVTIPQAIAEWVNALASGSQEQEEAPEEDPEQAPEEEAPPEEAPEETTASETVYATDAINIRKEPNETAEKVGSAVKGDSFTRTGTAEGGWSIIEYQGAKAYVKSEYLSTEAPAAENTADSGQSTNTGLSYVPEGKVLTMNSSVNIRKSMSETSEKMGTTQIGDTIKVILSYAEGWTKVEWNGKTGYIKTELLLNN